MEALRLFVGIDVGNIWSERLSKSADRLREVAGRSVRWVRPELYHVTVVFLGSQPSDAVDRISEAMTAAGASVEPFELTLGEHRRLGGHERGALVVSVHDPSGRLQRLRSRIDQELGRRRIAFDAKPLVPHVTLGRPRGRSGPLPLAPVDLRGAPPLLVETVTLVKSDLLQTGPRYEVLVVAPVGSSQAGEHAYGKDRDGALD